MSTARAATMTGKDAFEGCWRIDWMEAWDQEATDIMGPAFINFEALLDFVWVMQSPA